VVEEAYGIRLDRNDGFECFTFATAKAFLIPLVTKGQDASKVSGQRINTQLEGAEAEFQNIDQPGDNETYRSRLPAVELPVGLLYPEKVSAQVSPQVNGRSYQNHDKNRDQAHREKRK